MLLSQCSVPTKMIWHEIGLTFSNCTRRYSLPFHFRSLVKLACKAWVQIIELNFLPPCAIYLLIFACHHAHICIHQKWDTIRCCTRGCGFQDDKQMHNALSLIFTHFTTVTPHHIIQCHNTQRAIMLTTQYQGTWGCHHFQIITS